jgi:hypothetical protein
MLTAGESAGSDLRNLLIFGLFLHKILADFDLEIAIPVRI